MSVWCYCDIIMELNPYVTALRRQLEAASAAGGEEAAALTERLTAPLEAGTRLVLLEALSAAAGEISAELAPGSVDLRLRGGEPEFVVAPAPADDDAAPAGATPWTGPGGESAATARINLRLPEALKSGVEAAAAAAGLSVNTWLIRAIAASVGGDAPAPAQPAASGRRYRGWVA
jgi:hypothetical protein